MSNVTQGLHGCKPEARMAGQRNGSQGAKVVRRALVLVTEAMDLLDALGTQRNASAHLAMAQQALRQAIFQSDG